MAEDQLELRHVNWKETFAFTHIFKGFRMAIHPSKLLLCLAAIVLIFVFGHLMDWVWSWGNQYAGPNEITSHYVMPWDSFNQKVDKWEDGRLSNAAQLLAETKREAHGLGGFQTKLQGQALPGAFRKQLDDYNAKEEKDYKEVSDDDVKASAQKQGTSWKQLLGDAKDGMAGESRKVEKLLAAARTAARDEIRKNEDKKKREEALDDLDQQVARAHLELTNARFKFADDVRGIRGTGIFGALMEYEWQSVRNAISAVSQGNFLGGLRQYREKVAPPMAVQYSLGAFLTPGVAAGGTPGGAETLGFIYWVLMAWQGVMWLICTHWLYALIFLVFSLAVVALCGGAVNRIAAVHFAREDKISIAQALKFSASKFVSFFCAPLLPLGLILLLGLCLAFGGLLGWLVGFIPYVGDALFGLLFFLAILVGLAIAFVSIGLLSGMWLMYPTIAVEGSDSFDAMSRSFSYVFNRPWRAGLYAVVALLYGAMTYLFVRLFVFLTLAATHCFVKWGMIGQGQALGPGADKLDVLWVAPTFDRLFGPFPWEAMSRSEAIGAFFIGVYVFLTAALVVAYLLSYSASATTAIYFLLRRKVDATDLDDVYVEEPEEEPLPPAGEPPQTAAPTEQPKAPEGSPPAQG